MESAPQRPLRPLRLPALPDTAAKLCALVDDPDVGMGEIGELVAEDVALSGTVLRIANGSTYAPREPIASTHEAVALMGARALRNLTLEVAILEQYEHLNSLGCFDVTTLWEHSGLTARLARQLRSLSQCEALPHPDECFTCGLLHDLGRVVLLDTYRDNYVKLLDFARTKQLPSHAVERQVLGTDHMAIGAQVAESWRLPVSVLQAARDHHDVAALQSGDASTVLVIAADRLANAIEREGELDSLSATEAVPPLLQGRLALAPNWIERLIAMEAERSGVDAA